MIFPVAGNGNGSQAPAATNNTLRMSSDAGPILRNAERRYARSPVLFPSNGMQHRHNRMMPLQAPSFPRCGRTGAFFMSGIFKRRRHSLLIPSRNQGYSVFTEECIIFTICERKILTPQYLWQTRDSNPFYTYHPWIIHHHAVVSFRPWAWPLAPWLPVPLPTPRK